MKTLKPMLACIFFILISIWLGLLVFVYLMQERMIFIPGKGLTNTPDQVGLPFEEVYLMTADKVRIHGWFIPHEAPRATLLFFHGNAGNISHRLDSITLFHKLRLSVFIIDYRGYGLSDGRPSEQGTYKDADAAWDYLVTERAVSPDKIIIFGRSLGGGIAGYLAREVSPGAVIFESTFTSIKAIGRRHYPYLPISLMARIHYPTDSNILLIKSPILVIHSEQDELIPYQFGQRLFEIAPAPKMFLTIHGDHNNGFLLSEDIYVEGLNRFISAYIDDVSEPHIPTMR